MNGKYFSTFTGEEISYAIQCLKDMHPMIKVIDATGISEITCFSTTDGVEYNETATVVDGECLFNLPQYADYNIVYTKSNVETTILQPVYEFKQFEVSLADD